MITLPRNTLLALAATALTIHLQAGQEMIPAFQNVPAPEISREDSSTRPLSLKLLSDKANQIIDEEAWWASNQLESPFLKVPVPLRNEAGNLPASMPVTLPDGRRVVAASRSGERPFAIYGADFSQGDRVLIFDPRSEKVTHALDFSAWIQDPFHIIWIQVVDGIVYLSYGSNGYAKEVAGKTAYLAAYELDTLRFRWRSPPLVANSRNFLILGDRILSGYGFTAEPDFLHIIERRSGNTVKSIKVASGPDFLVVKGERLFVRCYNRDYVFSLSR